MKLFADDTVVYLTVQNSSDANIRQANMDRLECGTGPETRSLTNMAFNPSKCQ